MRQSMIVFFILAFAVSALAAQTVWLDELDLSLMDIGWGSPRAKRSVDGNVLRIAGQRYDRGVGTHAVSTYLLNLDGAGKRFHAAVGLDDEASPTGSIEFFVLGDKSVLWRSGRMKKGDPAKLCDVDITGRNHVGLLVTDGGDGINNDHADWADARLELAAARTKEDLVAVPGASSPTAVILTPKPSSAPRINSPRIFGVRPGNPFLYTVVATGHRPLLFSAVGLPAGLTLDSATGIITGVLQTRGTYRVSLFAKNVYGISTRELRIEVGDRIALTPPMGWNSWNCWACAVDDEKVRASADALVASGLMDHGWTYINIDDCWEIKPDAADERLNGEPRDEKGMIRTNKKFPAMKALADYVHGKGLKIGIYSSPGSLTCAGYTASYQHEEQDARQYAGWGIDYLKYDWCSYGRLVKNPTLEDFKKPYRVMRTALDRAGRDIVYSLCQYGMGNVWEWGDEVGGNCWRTTGDIVDSWSSMSGIGFGQAGHEAYAKPGNWNDPDMLVVGMVGWGPSLHPTRLTPDEQYTHISLWSLLASPLLIGCDLTRMDAFTMNLLTNDEVLEVNQDPLGVQARRVRNENGVQVWVKEMEDGSKAVGVFNVGRQSADPVDMFNWDGVESAKVRVKAGEIGFSQFRRVRDLWRQEDLAAALNQIEISVLPHGVALLRCWGGDF